MEQNKKALLSERLRDRESTEDPLIQYALPASQAHGLVGPPRADDATAAVKAGVKVGALAVAVATAREVAGVDQPAAIAKDRRGGEVSVESTPASDADVDAGSAPSAPIESFGRRRLLSLCRSFRRHGGGRDRSKRRSGDQSGKGSFNIRFHGGVYLVLESSVMISLSVNFDGIPPILFNPLSR